MILKKKYQKPAYNLSEILRYSGTKESTPDVEKLMEECILEADRTLSYQVCYGMLPVTVQNDEVAFLDFNIVSKQLAKTLISCESVVLFAATVGIEIDRLISKYSKLSPAKALMFQAIGAERIEALCDAFCKELSAEYEKAGKALCRRFSPGYGDFSMEHQKDFFRILDCHRKIGLTLNESMLMSPSKSVTAIVGIVDRSEQKKTGCAACDKIDCEYRKRNTDL